jgi:integrase/recombinase XerD
VLAPRFDRRGDVSARRADVETVTGETLPRGRALTAGELTAIFRACADGTVAGTRDAALIATLYAAGLRRSEVVALDLEDYDAPSSAVTVRRGKGAKDRMTYVSNGAADAVTDWIVARTTEAGPLFGPVDKSDQPTLRRMTGQAVLYILRRRAKEANVPRCSPHDLRRTFISDLLGAGADISAVRALAGHSSVATTMIYDRRGEEAKVKAAALLHVPYIRRVPVP